MHDGGPGIRRGPLSSPLSSILRGARPPLSCSLNPAVAKHCRLSPRLRAIVLDDVHNVDARLEAIDRFVKAVLRRDVGRLRDFLFFSPFRQGKRAFELALR